MTHEQALERLDDFACDELPDIERVMVQRHLDGCGECRAEVEAIRALLADVAALPAGIAPPADLWAGIEARLEPRAAATPIAREEARVIPFAPRRRVWEPPRWALQLAAALVLVAGSSLVTAKVMQQRQGTPGGPVALGTVDVTRGARPVTTPAQGATQAVPVADTAASTVPGTQGDARFASNTAPASGRSTTTAYAAFRPAERDYQRAIDDLQKVLETKRGQMEPETVATLERNLRIIDAAIDDSKRALEKDPNSRELTQMLSATYDAKVQALRQAVEL
jgi:tetratricopeptide (TPR) repeat protein